MTVEDAPAERGAGHGRRQNGWAMHALVFCTSAAVLVLEILAGRLVAPYVGMSLETYTGIIGTVLAGIALGSAVGGWAADRRDPRLLLGPVLLASGAASVAAVPIIGALGPRVTASRGGPGAIVVLAATAFVLPTALLSAVPPMAAKLRLSSTATAGTVVGGLSASGTAGALVGTFATGFVFVAAWPTRPIVVTIGIVLAAAGLAFALAYRRRPQAAVLGVVALALVLAEAVPSPCQQETRYYCADVVADPERPSGRALLLDSLRHSYVDLDDPTHLEFRYTRLFAAVIDAGLEPGPLDVVHIGGGGFTLPRWLAATRPGTTSTVLELDPQVVEIAERHLGLRTSGDLRVRTGDARLNVAAEPGDGYDLAVGDAFGGLSVPWHLTTVEMVREVDRVLRPQGLYVLNVIDDGPRGLVRAEAATLAAVFSHVAVVAPVRGPGGNHVLVASQRPLPLDRAVAPDGTLLAGARLERFIGGAEVLRDDHAPADQLLTHR